MVSGQGPPRSGLEGQEWLKRPIEVLVEMFNNAMWAVLCVTVLIVSSSGSALAEEGGGGGESKKDKAVEGAKVDINKLLEEADDHARRGNFKQAIPIYKEVLQLRPSEYPAVYYNLAEINRSRKGYGEAAMLYKRYLEVSPEAGDKEEVLKHIAECLQNMPKTGKVNITVTGAEDPLIVVDGIPVSSSKSVELVLRPGKYTLSVSAEDYIPSKSSFEVLSGDDKGLDVALKAMTFFGMLEIKANVEGAEVLLDGKPAGKTPLEPVKLTAGKYFVEFKKDGYHRWIRNIVLGRDEVYLLNVTLQKMTANP